MISPESTASPVSTSVTRGVSHVHCSVRCWCMGQTDRLVSTAMTPAMGYGHQVL